MSLLKNINYKFVPLIFFIFFCLNLENFPGNKLIFFIYHLVSYFLYLTIVRKKINYFEFFFFSLLFLGFWVKPNFIFLFNIHSFRFSEGDIKLIFDSYNVFNDSFIVIITSFTACILGSFLREYVQNKINLKKNYEINKNFLSFYKENRSKILYLYIFVLCFLWLINFYFQIYSKGLVNDKSPFLIKSLFAWNFNYGLSAITAILIYVDMHIYRQKKIIFLGLFETFFTNLTILSRAFLIFFLAYLKGFYDLLVKLKVSIVVSKKFSIYLIIIFCLFLTSFFLVDNLRNKKFNSQATGYESNIHIFKYEVIKNSFIKLSSLATTRWVGIDSLLSVSNYDEKSINLFVSSLSEKKEIRKHSFYMEHFFKSFKFEQDANPSLNTVILPGLIAFLYYSGSYIFVAIGVLIFIFLFSFIEYVFFKFSNCNNVLASIIGFTLAWRLSHFGYLPLNTFKFLLSFFLTFIIITIITKVVWKK